MSGQPGQGERREPATDVRLDGDEVTADADDGIAGHYSGTYMSLVSTWNGPSRYRSTQHRQNGCPAGSA